MVHQVSSLGYIDLKWSNLANTLQKLAFLVSFWTPNWISRAGPSIKYVRTKTSICFESSLGGKCLLRADVYGTPRTAMYGTYRGVYVVSPWGARLGAYCNLWGTRHSSVPIPCTPSSAQSAVCGANKSLEIRSMYCIQLKEYNVFLMSSELTVRV